MHGRVRSQARGPKLETRSLFDVKSSVSRGKVPTALRLWKPAYYFGVIHDTAFQLSRSPRCLSSIFVVPDASSLGAVDFGLSCHRHLTREWYSSSRMDVLDD